MLSRRLLLAAPAALAGPALAAPALAQPGTWPTRPVRIIVPFPPGGSQDVLTRILAEKLGERLRQSFVVENRAGANGLIGLDTVAKSRPDGHTFGVGGVGQIVIAPYLYSMPFDLRRDLVPVAMVWDYANVAVAAPEHLHVPDLAALVAWAKAQPQGVFYAISSVGTPGHLCTALFCERAGIKGTHMAVRGGAGIQLALTQGEAAFTLDGGVPAFAGAIQQKALKAFAVTSAERWPGMEDVPTMAEAGFPDFVITAWTGLMAPTGTPAEAIAILQAAIEEIVKDAPTRARALAAGGRLLSAPPAAVQARMEAEGPLWRDIIQRTGTKVE
ncbi:tripartite tricarboxylate transporter substrate binding protein [Roseomonas sp. OT10]|uniref:Bug family tripartite tricarboxylate transporter substrate binding protein n=1 Tax=Roseomonas cutis TaxID=2897332 RepID=UPI001E353887|nr:tripartite tricarboxylate transporter substrate binding protein [Roseomonas sp. OT10]UFN48393.1 tripartite tricarboxylate transporter substrate binding protein [Roseomonas sp. OT10]